MPSKNSCGGGIRTHDLQVLMLLELLPGSDYTIIHQLVDAPIIVSERPLKGFAADCPPLKADRVSSNLESFSIPHYCDRSQFNYEPDELPLLYPAISI